MQNTDPVGASGPNTPSPWKRLVRVLAVAVAVVIATTSTAEAIPGEVLRGRAYLSKGRNRQAAMAFRSLLENDPDNSAARAGLVDAFRGLDRCAEISVHGWWLEGTRHWKPSVMLALAECAIDVGSWDEAEALIDEAIERDTPVVDPPMVAARLCVLKGDEACLDEAWAIAVGRDRGPAHVIAHEAELAVLAGASEAEAMVKGLVTYGFVPEVVDQQRILTAQIAGDEGDCEEVQELTARLVSSSPSSLQVAAVRAELLRRCDDAGLALIAFQRPAVQLRAHTTEARSVHVRILVDLERLDEAEAMLDTLPAGDPRVVASRWYLARARGDEATMAAAAAAWQANPFFGARSLDHLVPQARDE